MTCAGRPASGGHEMIDAETFASWGVDYLKVRDCRVLSSLLPCTRGLCCGVHTSTESLLWLDLRSYVVVPRRRSHRCGWCVAVVVTGGQLQRDAGPPHRVL